MQIRRYKHEDIPKILQLIRAVYDEHVYEKAAGRFEWQYEHNPSNTPGGPLNFVLEDGDRILGMIGAFAQRVKIDDNIYSAYWLGDFSVHPDFRGNHHGSRLVRRIIEEPGLGMGFPGVGGKKNQVNPWLRIGATSCTQLVEYFRITGHFDSWIDSLFNKSLKEIQIIDIKHFDERFDRLWEKISKNYRIIQVRDSSFLNWRFLKCPHLVYRVLAAVKNNEILGYIVIRDRKINKILHEGNIVDIFFDKSDSIVTKALINAGIRALKSRGCNLIKMVVSADDKFLNDTLRQCFFWFCKKRERGLFLNNTGRDINSILEVSSNWFLTKTDLDSEFSW